jgi:hypothetical protein
MVLSFPPRSFDVPLAHWTVISSRDVQDASLFLKARVDTIELPNGTQGFGLALQSSGYV